MQVSIAARGAGGLEFEDLDAPEDVGALPWDELYAACPESSPFQSPDWLCPWIAAFAPEAPRIWALRRAGRLVGLAPFYLHSTPAGARQLTLIGNGISDRLDLLAAPGERGNVAAAVLRRLAEEPGWDTCDFRDLPWAAPLASTPLPFAAAEDLREPDTPCPRLTLPADLDGLFAPLGGKARYNLRRSARRLAAFGEVAFRTASAETLACDLAALARLHAARWSARGGPGVLAASRVRAFHAAAAPRLLAAGLLRLDLLTVDGRVAAAHYGFRRAGCGYSYLHGFDPELSAGAPGVQLMAHVLAEAVRDGLRTFDFLRGGEAYKYDWGARDVPQVRRRIRR